MSECLSKIVLEFSYIVISNDMARFREENTFKNNSLRIRNFFVFSCFLLVNFETWFFMCIVLLLRARDILPSLKQFTKETS
jgi:hypothetical protein